LHPDFDELRAYARFGTGHFQDFVVPTLLNHDLEGAVRGFLHTGSHGLLLLNVRPEDGRAAVFVAVSQVTVGRVDLSRAECSHALPEGAWALLRLGPEDGAVSSFTFPDDLMAAMVEPGAFGPEMANLHAVLSEGPRR
jgi:hypothetical protein